MNIISSIVYAENRKITYEYTIIKSFEAGIVLIGSEVKSIRMRLSSIKEAYCYEYKGEIFIKNYNISNNSYSEHHDSLRIKKMLLKKREIQNIIGILAQNKYSLIPQSIYAKKDYIKVKIVLGKGKKRYDKRRTIKERDLKRELEKNIALKTNRPL